ncbi:CAAX prenyl protease-related protein [candidate division KSB3 bacterium]|uniref:CAAX prenyl protease-related protein n=1 Tax=candidate division KSB3 bacterium TaxID=2044937 RepID=A0A9D5Q8K8_9BACT|nr:CAAX prenyl protease-related protein [candidate division KSB3 bacterium]MBD3327462.1 CAAX prenyl protease-related protein [candidate division KSB3 bacterium]
MGIPTSYRPYLVPFLAFLVLTYAGAWLPHGTYVVYPIKTVVVAGLLWYYRKAYREVTRRFSWVSIGVGVVVFVVWVVPEGWYPQLGTSEFNPYTYGEGGISLLLILFRLAGAVIVVPVFEELFWRSFVIRWLIEPDFRSVPVGQFTWFSCIATVLGFGFEHHRWLVGLVAGVLYNGLLYSKKDLTSCIIAHAVTNLLLGIYVLLTQQWTFW